jgi:pyridoxamine 5'-phosphate oxidase family protein
MSFKPHEIEFMKAADLARLATIQPDGTLQNNPVGFAYNEDLGTIDIHGYWMSKSQKFRNVASNNTVALVIDDIVSRDPWRVRCLEIRGTAERAESGERRTEPNGLNDNEIDTAIIRVTPRRIISFGIDDIQTEPHQLIPDNRDVPTTAD